MDEGKYDSDIGDDESGRTVIQQVPVGERRTAARQEWAHFLVHHDARDPQGAASRLRLGTIPLRIGRRPPCELILHDSDVSGLHCEVRLQGDDVVVNDLGSTNGTFIDGQRVQSSSRLPNGSALQVGRHFIKLELRDQRELAQSEEINRDLERASRYVQSLLPAPLRSGPVRIEWFFQPSAKVGGDGFGYYALDEHRVVGYVIDVSGHGVGAAMHLVTVMNALRQKALPDTDLANPAQVLARLNAMFQMDRHDGMFFSIWYGVYDVRDRRLAYASGGHHPAYLLAAQGGALRTLRTRNLVIGALPEASFEGASTRVELGDRVYLFSDGVFEIVSRDARPWGLDDFLRLLPGQADDPALTEPEHLFRAVRQIARPGPLDDDFSILVVKML